MEKIPVNLIISKNKKRLAEQCSIWYIPSCPVDIHDADEWYKKISYFIDTHLDEYNVLHIPNSIYDKEYSYGIKPVNDDMNEKPEQNFPINHLFIVGMKTSTDENGEVPDYHIAYCIQRDVTIYKKEETFDIVMYCFKLILFYIFAIIFLCFISIHVCPSKYENELIYT